MPDPDAAALLAISAIAGALVTTIARFHQKKKIGWRSTISILYADYVFEEYATLNLLSLLYAILSGLLSGLCVGFAFLGLQRANSFELQSNLALSLACFLLIIVTRLTVEGYTVIYKTARDANRYFILSSKQIISQLGESSEQSESVAGIRGQGSVTYNKRQMFRAIQEEVLDQDIISGAISYGNTSFGEDKITVRDVGNNVVVVFTKTADGQWSIQGL